MNRLVASLVILLCANDLVAPASAWQIAIDTVPVGNAGNAPDTVIMVDGTTGYGSVGYDYQIGKYEVTNAQYAAFLNAKAKSDPLALYNPVMGVGSNPYWGGITRSGAEGSYAYTPIPGRESWPVTNVSWYDTIRFANWLHNSQGNGDTETGAYTILSGAATPSNGLSIIRNPGATWFLPSEDEWYKAAYYNPGASSYFLFPTGSNIPPTAEAPPGGANSANYNLVVGGDLTTVGAYSDTESPYGAFDLAGNPWEWNEALIADSQRGLRGGSFMDNSSNVQISSFRTGILPWGENGNVGFRVGAIPEPSTLALAGIGLAALLGSGVVRRRPSLARGLGVGLLSMCAFLGLPFGNGQVANAQSQLTTRVDIYDSSTDAWSTAELSQARANLAAVSAGGKALFAGGGASLPFASDRVDLFDPSTGQWSTASLSQPRIAIAATSVGDLALFGGGYNGQGQGLSSVDIYDAAKNQWTQSSFSVPRVAGAATTVGDRALFAGGSVDLSYTTTDVVDIYDAPTGQWTSAHLSQARALLAATTAGGKAFFAGGYDGQGTDYSDVVDIYDASTNQWSVAHLSQPRAQLVAAAAGSKVFFAGGMYDASFPGHSSAVVDIFDTDTGQWSIASLSQARHVLAAAGVGNKAYFAGGSADYIGATSYTTVDVYDGNTGLWSVDHLSLDRHYLAGTAVGDLVLFGGGYSIPEPATIELAAVALLGLLGWVGLRRWRRQTSALLAALVATSLVSAPTASADIFRWDNSQVIPGTEGITPGPGMQLDQWNAEAHNLRYADFAGGLDLHQASFRKSWLDNARFNNANLSNSDFGPPVLANFGEAGATLTGADLSGANLTGAYLGMANLTSASLRGANLTGSYFGRTSTYPGVVGATLTSADLSGANLTGADLSFSTLNAANLSEALVGGANFGNSVSRGFTQAQLASTASYQAKGLQGVNLSGNDMGGWDFSGQDLTGAVFFREGSPRNPWEGFSGLGGANLNEANLTGADLTFWGSAAPN